MLTARAIPFYEEDYMHKQFKGILAVPTLRFSKTGKQIKEVLSKSIKGFEKENADLKKKIAEICKKREIDPKEILESKTSEDFLRNSAIYSTRMESAVAGLSKGVLQSLQDDINELQTSASTLSGNLWQIEMRNQVASNIEPNRKHDLTYAELSELGF